MSKDKLTDSKLRTAKPEAKEYSLGDGDGLYLRVKPNGARLWVFNYYRPSDKKRANISFGPYPDVTLAAARERRREARALLAQAIDPKRHKEEQIAFVQAEQEANANTFERMAAMWLELKRHDVSEAYADDSWRSLELYVLPFIGSMPINQLRAPKVIEMLRPIEADGKHETVRRLCQRINEILDYSVNHGLLDANPCAAIRKVFKKPSKKHMPTLKPTELPMLMADIANGRLDHTTRCIARSGPFYLYPVSIPYRTIEPLLTVHSANSLRCETNFPEISGSSTAIYTALCRVFALHPARQTRNKTALGPAAYCVSCAWAQTQSIKAWILGH